MRNLIFLFLIALFSPALLAQVAENDQNPNYRASMEKYMNRKDTLLQNMGETVQQTYKAIDPIADRKEARLERQEERRQFRRALRLERARRPQIFAPRRRGWGWNNGWNNGWNTWNYGWNSWDNSCPPNSYFIPWGRPSGTDAFFFHNSWPYQNW